MTIYYLRLEGVNFGYVLCDTDQLSVVRGASLLLRQAVKDVALGCGKLEPLATGASTGLFRFKADNDGDAGKIRDDTSKFLNEDDRYRHFTFVVDACPEGDGFETDKEAVIALNRFRQVQQMSLAVPAKNPNNSKPCEWDGKRVGEVPLGVERDEEVKPIVSRSVEVRHEYGRKEKQRFYREELQGVCDEQVIADLKFAHDLHQIAKNKDYGNLNDKIAVIYFDGNGFGGIQARHCGDPGGLQKWDDYIQRQRRRFLCDFLKDYAADEDFFIEITTKHDKEKRMRLETLLWGGDDITLVVPAWRGFEVLHYFYEKSKGWAFAGEPLTHAGGIVFCHVKTPIYRMRALAEELAEHVKATPGGRNDNYYEHMALESIDYPAEPVSAFWERRYGKTLQTCRLPLKRIDNYRIWQPRLREVLEKTPKGQVYAIVRAALGQPGCRPNMKAFEDRLKRFTSVVDKKVRADLDACLDKLFPNSCPVWRWLHLAELWDYLAPEKKRSVTGVSAPASRRAAP